MDARIVGIVESSAGAIAVVQTGNTDESVRQDRPLRGLLIGPSSLTMLPWSIESGLVATSRPAKPRPSDLVNPGPTALTTDVDADGAPEFLLRRAHGDEDVLAAIDAMTGREVRSFRPGVRINYAIATGTMRRDPVLVSLEGGELAVLDAALDVVARFPIDGFYRSDAGNFHGYDPAIVADLDGDGINEIYANTAAREVVRLQPGRAPETISSGRDRQEPVAIEGSLLLRACAGVKNSICRVDPNTRVPLWQTTLMSNEARVPISFNLGRFGQNRELGLVVAAAPLASAADDWLRKSVTTVYAIALDGRILWQAPRGPWYDATFAIADFDGDGADDVVYNYQLEKGRLLSGRDGRELISEYALLPTYRDLGHVDYAGAPIVIDLGSDGIPELVNAEDGAHVALLRADFRVGLPSWRTVWLVPQSNLDDERMQMPAAAPFGDGAILGGGSARGVFIARNASTGETLWHRTLISTTSTYGTALTKTISLDVNSDGRFDFIVGGEDGRLHALDAISGSTIWVVDFQSPLGDPIAGDIDGDGFSEIVVSTGDGWLHVVREPTPRRRSVAR